MCSDLWEVLEITAMTYLKALPMKSAMYIVYNDTYSRYEILIRYFQDTSQEPLPEIPGTTCRPSFTYEQLQPLVAFILPVPTYVNTGQ